MRSIDCITKFCGKKPAGYTAPLWATSKELIGQLQEMGIVYDHSFMHHDLQPYYAPDNTETWIETNIKNSADSWMYPMSTIKPSKVVEIPANWHLDDWPPLQPIPDKSWAQGYVDTHVVERFVMRIMMLIGRKVSNSVSIKAVERTIRLCLPRIRHLHLSHEHPPASEREAAGDLDA